MLVSWNIWCAFFFVATVLRFNFLPYYRRNIRIQPKVASNIETFTYVDNLTTVLNMRQFCYRQKDKLRLRKLKQIETELEIEQNYKVIPVPVRDFSSYQVVNQRMRVFWKPTNKYAKHIYMILSNTKLHDIDKGK